MPVARGQELVVGLTQQPPAKFAGFDVVNVQTSDGAKLIFGDDSWLLFRQSGTEPVLRIYSEATSVEKMNALLEAGTKLTKN
jgi:phosphomannomutase